MGVSCQMGRVGAVIGRRTNLGSHEGVTMVTEWRLLEAPFYYFTFNCSLLQAFYIVFGTVPYKIYVYKYTLYLAYRISLYRISHNYPLNILYITEKARYNINKFIIVFCLNKIIRTKTGLF